MRASLIGEKLPFSGDCSESIRCTSISYSLEKFMGETGSLIGVIYSYEVYDIGFYGTCLPVFFA